MALSTLISILAVTLTPQVRSVPAPDTTVKITHFSGNGVKVDALGSMKMRRQDGLQVYSFQRGRLTRPIQNIKTTGSMELGLVGSEWSEAVWVPPTQKDKAPLIFSIAVRVLQTPAGPNLAVEMERKDKADSFVYKFREDFTISPSQQGCLVLTKGKETQVFVFEIVDQK